MSSTPPGWEPTPGYDYQFGEALGQGCGCFIASTIVNVPMIFFSMLTVSNLIAACMAGLGNSDPPLMQLGISFTLAVASRLLLPNVARRLRRKGHKVNRRNRERNNLEQNLQRAVEDAIENGESVHAAINGITVKDGANQRALNPAHDLAFSYGIALDTNAPVTVDPGETRAHELVTGGSGAGKSKFIASRAADHAVLGDSLLVIDPHEELAADILGAVAPHLMDRSVILLWPGGPLDHLFPWNPLAPIPGVEAWERANTIVGAVKRVWQLTEANTYLLDTFKHGAWAMAESGWSILEMGRFLTDESFRNWIGTLVESPPVKDWIKDFNQLDRREQQGRTQSTIVRLNRLLANPHLRRMLGAGVSNAVYVRAMHKQQVWLSPSNDLVGAIRRGTHVFAVLPKRTLKEDQYLLAGLTQAALM